MSQITVTKCPIEGLYIIEPTVHGDNRGYFMETYNQRDMEENGLTMRFVQDNQSSSVKGVLRGMHLQKEHPQGKLVRVIQGRVGQVYNIGGHNEMRNIDIVKIICRALGKPESLITFVTDRKGHDMRYAIDPTKIHNELGWLPETKFVDGIKKTIRWYLDNREWWENIINGEYQNYYERMYGNR